MFAVIKPVKGCGVTWEGGCCLPLAAEGRDQTRTNSYEICDLESDIGTGSSKSIFWFSLSISVHQSYVMIFSHM